MTSLQFSRTYWTIETTQYFPFPCLSHAEFETLASKHAYNFLIQYSLGIEENMENIFRLISFLMCQFYSQNDLKQILSIIYFNFWLVVWFYRFGLYCHTVLYSFFSISWNNIKEVLFSQCHSEIEYYDIHGTCRILAIIHSILSRRILKTFLDFSITHEIWISFRSLPYFV